MTYYLDASCITLLVERVHKLHGAVRQEVQPRGGLLEVLLARRRQLEEAIVDLRPFTLKIYI